MQETLPISFNHQNEIHLFCRSSARGLKWIVVGVWKPIRWLLEAMFTEHPAEKYLEENRLKAIRLVGHF